MRLAVGFDRHEICRSTELRSGDRPLFVSDEGAARDILGGLLGDAIGMADLRRLLGEESLRDLWDATDHDVIDALARRLVSGRLRLVANEARRLPAIPAASAPTIAPAPAPEPVQTRAPAPPPTATPAPTPAPATADTLAQAQALTLAARDGTPFCEECARARAGAAQQEAF